LRYFLALALWLGCVAADLRAQGNYEVQVYGSDLVAPSITMVELHSNFTAIGSKGIVDGVLPTNQAEHETVEITHGFNDWFECGFYIFTTIQEPGGPWIYVGSHIRPRFAVPEKYHLPVGLSLSNEIGWQRPEISLDTWTWEIRPIVDKKIQKWYFAFNPALDLTIHGPDRGKGLIFSPNFKWSYDITKRIAAGIEYYGSLGPVTGFYAVRGQEQEIVPALDIDFGRNWEFNFGVGIGVTQATDHLLIKAILGYRFNNKKS
jgi:hypothetical protein